MPPGQPEAPNDPSIQSGNSLDVLDAGQKTNLIIEVTRAFQVAMEFELAGFIASLLVGAPMTYTVTYTFDELGGANEGVLGAVTKNTQAGQLKYNAATPAGAETVLNVAAGALPPATYRLNSRVTFKLGAANVPLFAFTDGPVIEIVPG